MKCPKCSYERQPTDIAPDWQCPSCQVAYAKVLQAQNKAQPPAAPVAIEPSPETLDASPAKGASKAIMIVSWIGGAAFARYFGLVLLFPALATAGIWWSSKRFLPASMQTIVPALSVNAGHFLWMCSAIVVTGIVDPVTADLVVYVVGLIWLLRTRSAGPLLLLGVYQALSLAVNAVDLAAAPLGSIQHKALLAHIFWRIWALALIVKLYFVLRQAAGQIAGKAT